MNAFELLYDGSVIAIETMLLIIFVSNSLKRKTNIFLVFVIITALQILRRVIFGQIGMLSLIPSSAIDITVVYFCFSGKRNKKMFFIAAFYSLIFVFDSVAMLILSLPYVLLGQATVDVDTLLLPATLLSKAFTLSVILILKKTVKIDNSITESLKYLPAPVFTIIALVWGSPYSNDINNKNMSVLLVIVCIFSIISNIYLFVILRRSNEKRHLQYRLDILAENKKQSSLHHQELQSAYRQIERTAHDIKHHLDYIEAAPDLESAVKYAQKLKERSYSEVFKFTGNFDTDTIMNAKNNEMIAKGITLKINGLLPTSIEWLEAVDVSIILGNGLSNAIEACQRCNGREITISFKYDDDWLLISIENPTGDMPARKKTGIGFISSKKDENHGIGMESMAASVERYDGMMKFNVEDGKFRLDILLQRGNKN